MAANTISIRQKSIYGLPDIIFKAAFSIIFTLLMVLSANTFAYLPFTPVPVTMQVLTVLFSALMLGGPWALTSQVGYIAMGLAGMPVFAGFAGGPAALLGPTGGYLIGFALAAYITGLLSSGPYLDNIIKKTSFWKAFIACVAGLLVIYTLGGVHFFGFLYNLSTESRITDIIRSVWVMGIRPFIILDMAKVLIAIIILRPGTAGYEDNKNK